MAEAAWRGFAALLPEGPRRPVRFHGVRHSCLDEALAVAHSFLAAWDPRIDLCGVPDEAHYGIALTGANGESGRLTAQPAGQWTLRWDAGRDSLREHWTSAAWEDGNGTAWACAGTAARDASCSHFRVVVAGSGVASRQT